MMRYFFLRSARKTKALCFQCPFSGAMLTFTTDTDTDTVKFLSVLSVLQANLRRKRKSSMQWEFLSDKETTKTHFLTLF